MGRSRSRGVGRVGGRGERRAFARCLYPSPRLEPAVLFRAGLRGGWPGEPDGPDTEKGRVRGAARMGRSRSRGVGRVGGRGERRAFARCLYPSPRLEPAVLFRAGLRGGWPGEPDGPDTEKGRVRGAARMGRSRSRGVGRVGGRGERRAFARCLYPSPRLEPAVLFRTGLRGGWPGEPDGPDTEKGRVRGAARMGRSRSRGVGRVGGRGERRAFARCLYPSPRLEPAVLIRAGLRGGWPGEPDGPDTEKGRVRGAARIRTGDKGFAVLCLTTWPRRRNYNGEAPRGPR
jgi:hypothetical protein